MGIELKKLEDILAGNDSDDLVNELQTAEEEKDKEISNEISHISKMDDLVSAQGFADHDAEMDELSKMAISAHKELMDLGMNIELRHAGEIFASSTAMLKIAVDAKNAKVDKKLKLLKLQLDKMKIERSMPEPENESETLGLETVTVNFNQLLAEYNKNKQ